MDLSNSSEGRHSAEQLDLYDEGLRVLFPERHGVEGRAICKMRADAVRAAPKDEKLALACFRACLKRDSLEYAQQASPRNSAFLFKSGVPFTCH
jgi:hypothetical protein